MGPAVPQTRWLKAAVIGLLLLGTAWGAIHLATREHRPTETREFREETEAEAAAEIRTLGGTIEADERAQDRPVIGVNFGSAQVADAGLQHVKGLTQLRSLYLSSTAVTDAGLQHVKGLTQLRELSLRETAVTDTGLPCLDGLTKLRILHLNNTRVTDAGLPAPQGHDEPPEAGSPGHPGDR